MSLIVLLLSGMAQAEPLLPGVPVAGVDGLGPADFLTPALGWTAPIEGGFVRVFVGTSAAEADAWVQQAQMAITVPLPAVAGIGEAAWGDEDGLLLVRQGNLALQVRADGGARAVAETLLAAVPVEASDWPEPPTLQPTTDGRWQVEAPGAVAVRFADGGAIVPGSVPLTFTALPGTVVAWDALGRPSVWRASGEQAGDGVDPR